MKMPIQPNPKGTPDRTNVYAQLTIFETKSQQLDVDIFFLPDGFDENSTAHLLIMEAANHLKAVMRMNGQRPKGYVEMTKEELEGT